MSIAGRVSADNRAEHAEKIASLKERIVREIREAGRENPLSNHALYARINDGLDRKIHRLKIIPVADISSATGALKRKGVLADVGVGMNEKGNPETLMTLGEWANLPPDVKLLREAQRLRGKLTRKLVKLDAPSQVAVTRHFLRYIERRLRLVKASG
jgi:hypothetical protein